MKTLDLIPRTLYADGSAATIELGGRYSARIELKHDDSGETPWDMSDGHGPVSDWRPLDSKRAGERVLCTDRHSARFYDVAEATRLARKDGWDAPPYKTGTAGERAARAVEADFEFLRAWCADEWHYVGVCVTLLHGDKEVAQSSCWGVESLGDYWREIAAENVEDCQHQEKTSRRNAMKHRREQRRRANLMKCFC